MSDPQVRAAGGVVWQRRAGAVEILLVHRPRYDDWSLPKGKADPGESDADCALREVEEETGLPCRLGVELPSVRYRDNKGRDKIVRYWAMEAPAGAADRFTANDEVDEIRWLPVAEAVAQLSYEHDRPVVEALKPPPPG
ncbi:MAG TPA: NUDIX hydrolase [Acidimicrobiia bacterium]|nr:NUDIX hydrolase [Acidimicrobiia bacterium]